MRFDQFFVIRQAAHIHAELHARIERREPPRFRRAHGHAQRSQPLVVHLRAAREVVHRAKFVEHHHPVQYLPLPQHQLEGVFFALVTVLLVLALAKAPAIDRQRH